MSCNFPGETEKRQNDLGQDRQSAGQDLNPLPEYKATDGDVPSFFVKNKYCWALVKYILNLALILNADGDN
jgi:hypothetical protein